MRSGVKIRTASWNSATKFAHHIQLPQLQYVLSIVRRNTSPFLWVFTVRSAYKKEHRILTVWRTGLHWSTGHKGVWGNGAKLPLILKNSMEVSCQLNVTTSIFPFSLQNFNTECPVVRWTFIFRFVHQNFVRKCHLPHYSSLQSYPENGICLAETSVNVYHTTLLSHISEYGLRPFLKSVGTLPLLWLRFFRAFFLSCKANARV